ncbi:MAG TPA: hypothetical protein VKQ72_04630 [Aggregatilineales bacterium]|nr:hypothetical protein [Aggregatilineales bacterium]
MKRRRPILIAVVIVLLVLFVVFIFVGIPLIRDSFSTPIPGLPTSAPGSGNSLQARYTQTALAKTPGASGVAATAAP